MQFDEIDRWHKNRKPPFRMFGYHMLGHRSGERFPGRREQDTGAHVAGHNAHTLGYVLIGGEGCKRTDKFEDHFTPAQDRALRRQIDEWLEKYPTITKISGHHDHANRECPGFNVAEWHSTPKATNPWASILAFILKLLGRKSK